MSNNPNKGLIITIIVIGILISGSLIYLGYQSGNNSQKLSNAELELSVEKAIQKIIKKQVESQKKARSKNQGIANKEIKNVRRVTKGRDHIFGDPKAEISLIEYSDFECPYCKRFHSTAKQVVKSYPKNVNWIYRHFPLDFHNPLAQKEAEASECVNDLGGNKSFWKFADLIFKRTRSNGNGYPIQNLNLLAQEIGVDKKAFDKCLASGKFEKRVKEDLKEGSKIGIRGTPGNVLLNNKTGETIFLSGSQPFNNFKEGIEKLLK